MEPLVIAGAGGFGREVLQYARDLSMPVDGFLDDRPEALAGFGLDEQVLGPIAGHVVRTDRCYIIALGDPGARGRLARTLAGGGARFATLTHPRAWVAPSAQLGEGTIVAPGAVVCAFAKVGAHSALNVLCNVGHDAVLGEAVVMSPFAVCNGHARLGDAVFLGTHATVLAGVEIGSLAKVAAGAVVYQPVPERALAQGNPARSRVMFPPASQ